MFQVRLLGTFDVRGDDGVSRPLQAKRQALLAYLLLEGGKGPVRREKLAATFWPHLAPSRARNNLSQALHRFRAVLGSDVVRPFVNEISLDPAGFVCDALLFERHLRSGAPEAALSLYAGPLMDGFPVRRYPVFGRWLEHERERLQHLALDAALSLPPGRLDGESRAEAVRWARWAVRRAPYDERGLRHLMRLLAEEGRPAVALQECERFHRRLADELKMGLAEETAALASELATKRE